MNRIALCFALLLTSVVAAVGCGPRDHRCAVSGTITSNGEPVPVGVVNFIPEEPDPHKNVVGATANIHDGKYELPKPMRLLAGKYNVKVISIVLRDKKTGAVVDPYDVKDGKVNPLSLEDEDLVPPEFGKDSIQYLEVGKEDEITYDINMTSP